MSYSLKYIDRSIVLNLIYFFSIHKVNIGVKSPITNNDIRLYRIMWKNNMLGAGVVAVFVISVIFVQAQTSSTSHLVSPIDAKKMIEQGKFEVVIDVRTVEEYTGPMGHIKDAKLLPIQNLEAELNTLAGLKNKPILIYCHSGNRSARSARILSSYGFTEVFDLSNGITGWKRNGFPTVVGKTSLN